MSASGAIEAQNTPRWSARASLRALGSVGLTVAALTFAACSNAGDVGLINDSAGTVTVEYGGDGPEEVPGGGGVVLLGVDECFDGPIVVTYEGGHSVDLSGPICPGQELRIEAESAEVVAAS